MKKITVSLFIILALFTSCNYNNDDTSKISSSFNESIIEKDAINTITKKIGNNNGSRFIEIDRSETADGVDYYVVHAYSLGKPLDEEGTQMTYTYGWYYVNKKTGQAYECDMSNLEFKLNPLS